MYKKIISILIIINVFLLSIIYSINIYKTEELKEENKSNIILYYQEEKEKTEEEKESYIGILKIPKINLEQGFYNTKSKLNRLDMNIVYLKESIPISKNNKSMIILAAHRGHSKVAYFENLEKLELGDKIYLNYKHQNYTYVLRDIYDEERDGKLNIYRDKYQNSLILITCNRKYKEYQTIYVAYQEVN